MEEKFGVRFLIVGSQVGDISVGGWSGLRTGGEGLKDKDSEVGKKSNAGKEEKNNIFKVFTLLAVFKRWYLITTTLFYTILIIPTHAR